MAENFWGKKPDDQQMMSPEELAEWLAADEPPINDEFEDTRDALVEAQIAQVLCEMNTRLEHEDEMAKGAVDETTKPISVDAIRARIKKDFAGDNALDLDAQDTQPFDADSINDEMETETEDDLFFFHEPKREHMSISIDYTTIMAEAEQICDHEKIAKEITAEPDDVCSAFEAVGRMLFDLNDPHFKIFEDINVLFDLFTSSRAEVRAALNRQMKDPGFVALMLEFRTLGLYIMKKGKALVVPVPVE